MTFREYGVVHPKTLTASSPLELDQKIEALGARFEVIDLQYSTTTIGPSTVQFSALALIGQPRQNATR